MQAELPLQEANSAARAVYKKAESQSAEKEQNNIIETANIPHSQGENQRFEIERQIGGTFEVCKNEKKKIYSLTQIDTLEKLQNDWGMSENEAVEILEKAKNQNAVEDVLKSDGKAKIDSNSKLQQKKTESLKQPKNSSPIHKNRDS